MMVYVGLKLLKSEMNSYINSSIKEGYISLQCHFSAFVNFLINV